ncbi:MAG TPA: hypothetical protein VF306_22550 [Pirellulales bacterium]
MAASLPAVSTASFVLDPPSSEDIKWQPRRTAKLRPFLNGQVALIASWTALGCTPWYGRSAVAVLTFLLVTRTVQDADPVLARYFYQPWEIHTVALLSFTLFGALRAVGLRAEAADAAAGKRSSSRQFDLRRLFAWVTCAAVITLAWKHWFAVELQRGQSWPAGLPDCRQLAFATANSFAAAGLVANLILLRRKPLQWPMLVLVPPIAVFHTTVFYLTSHLTVRAGGLTWWQELGYFCRNDVLLYLGPVVCVLLLVRASGYRLAWPRAT